MSTQEAALASRPGTERPPAAIHAPMVASKVESPWIVAVAVMLATFMEVLDTAIASVALPYIAGSLSASTDEATWVLTTQKVGYGLGCNSIQGWGTIKISAFGAENMALTDAAIRVRKPATRPYKMYDRECLFLLVNPSGSKLWRWGYRADGKETLMALGEYPCV